jgi:drug/metabolite transporter (DMT)-like permease
VAAGLVIGDARLVPTWPGAGWLITLALTSQVLGWLLIGASLPRLPAAMTSVLLTVQPIGSVALAALIFSEDPSPLQLVGVVLVLAALVAASRSPRPVEAKRLNREQRRAHTPPPGRVQPAQEP